MNAGFGDAHSAAEEVEYMNGAANTHLGAQRAKNGHPEPYHIKFWNIGNEPWGTFQTRLYRPEVFRSQEQRVCRSAMRKVDPSITLIGSGKDAGTDVAAGRGPRQVRRTICSRCSGQTSDWTGGLLKKCWGTFDGIARALVRSRRAGTSISNKRKELPPDAPKTMRT